MEPPHSPHPESPVGGFSVDAEALPDLVPWRENVGDPVALDLAPALPPGVAQIQVLSWNVAGGKARLGELLVRALEARPRTDAGDPVPLVVLLQEAYRADETVPLRPIAAGHGGALAPGAREDVVDTARALGLSLRYAPSMRNGASRSDRGNAVLATAALDRAHAFSLPLVRQRRVAVAAELRDLPGLGFVSAHLENRKALRRGGPVALGLPRARASQAARLAEAVIRVDGPGSVVIGADLNVPFGSRDPAYRALLRAGLTPAERFGPRGHTLHTALRLVLDYVLYHSVDGRIASVRVRRLDEHSRDRGTSVFGSDHHPMLATVRLAASPPQLAVHPGDEPSRE
jgi:endonuclease/exonuclease/phosphatase family metal-dependent hydrolase